jgi:hypothetical protein
MTKPTELPDRTQLITAAAAAMSSKAVREILSTLPIVGDNDYLFDESNPERGWRQGFLHWYPVGRERGNAGRIKLAGAPENPIAERTINGMEALIEMMRQLELKTKPGTLAPQSPREAVLRYFDLPPLDALPGWPHPLRGQKAFHYARELARRLRVRLVRETRPVEYAILIEDEGIGQTPPRMHVTLLSLGQSDKPDKPYLIGVFGQGGSSAYAASEFSWIMSRRAPGLLDGDPDGLGWTVIKRINPVGRRDVYWAYLAAHPDGRVPSFSPAAAEAIGLKHGTRIAHINYNFGKTEPARTLYQSLNHLLFNPVLPYELYTGPTTGPSARTPDPMWGNGYRLAALTDKKSLDKAFAPQAVEKKGEEGK